MYTGPWSALPDTLFVDWPKLEDYTFENIVNAFIEEYRISENDTVAGVSLGGIIALEIANQVGCKELTLIGSAKARSEINQLLLSMAPLTTVTPVRFLQAIGAKTGTKIGKMFSDVDPEFMRAACLELQEWSPQPNPELTIRRIHGLHDQVIHCPKNADKIIKDGGHMIPFTHPLECVSFFL